MPYPYNNYYYPQNYPQQMPQQSTPQIQNGGFVSVRSEEEARNYPVAPGNSVTFKNETAPYIYTKTMGFSQLDRPLFDKFRLIKEDAQEAHTGAEVARADNEPQYVIQSEFEALRGIVEALQSDMEALRESSAKKATTKPKKEGDEA